jgi:hypothetical protein
VVLKKSIVGYSVFGPGPSPSSGGVQCGTAVEKAYKWLNGIACTQIVGICLTGLEERQGARSPDKVEDEASPCECQGDGFTAESVVVEEEEEEWSSRLETRLW